MVAVSGPTENKKMTQNQWLPRSLHDDVDKHSAMAFRARRSLLRDAFREGAPVRRSECGACARSHTLRSRAASATDRPAQRPACEELTALAPGRVLPFAPGNSRKRGAGAEPRGKSLGECRGGAPRGERARSALRR